LRNRKPGTVGKVFSTHPATEDRSKASQGEIEKDFPSTHECVVTMIWKARLVMLPKLDAVATATVRHRARAPGSKGPMDENEDGNKSKRSDEDDRPKL